MVLKELAELIEGRVVSGADLLNREVSHAFASDLMSDVLTVKQDSMVLLTGLANVQAVRTAEMSDIDVVVFLRGKRVSEDMVALARENGIVLIESNYSIFRASGVLFARGLKPIY